MFVITFQESPEMNAAEQARVRVGSKVKISATALGDPSPAPLISGEVTALEGEYRESKAPVLLVRGYDASHRLMRGRISEVHAQQKYSDIAGAIAGAAGLERGQIDDSGSVHEFVHQAAQTDWDFLRGLAREIGFEVAVRDGKLDFRNPPEAGSRTRRRRPRQHRPAPAGLRPGAPGVPAPRHGGRPGRPGDGEGLGHRGQA